MAIHCIESTLPCDKDNSSKNLPIIELLLSPVPLFIDMDIYYQPVSRGDPEKKGKRTRYATKEERLEAVRRRSREWKKKNPDYFKSWHAKRKAKNVSTAKSANPV